MTIMYFPTNAPDAEAFLAAVLAGVGDTNYLRFIASSAEHAIALRNEGNRHSPRNRGVPFRLERVP